jgi:hypothetical protein
MNEKKPQRQGAIACATLRSIAIVIVVFLAVCALIDLAKHQPFRVLTAERLAGVVGISVAIVIDAIRRSRKEN